MAKPRFPEFDAEVERRARRASQGVRGSFEQYAEAILREWERREHVDDKSRERAFNWFRRQAYRLLRHYIEAGDLKIFRRRVDKTLRSNRLVEEALKNPFKLGLLAMFSDESALSRNDRLVLGNQLLFAWTHDVPDDFLNPFITAGGGPAQIAARLRNKSPLPGFEHRFRRERLDL